MSDLGVADNSAESTSQQGKKRERGSQAEDGEPEAGGQAQEEDRKRRHASWGCWIFLALLLLFVLLIGPCGSWQH